MPGVPVTTEYGLPSKTIWARLHPGDAKTILISSADVTADSEGKKILPAGSIVGSITSGKTIFRDNEAAKVVNDATAEGVTVNDVDVTISDMEVAMAYSGAIAVDKMPVYPSDDAIKAMNSLVFMHS